MKNHCNNPNVYFLTGFEKKLIVELHDQLKVIYNPKLKVNIKVDQNYDQPCMKQSTQLNPAVKSMHLQKFFHFITEFPQ